MLGDDSDPTPALIGPPAADADGAKQHSHPPAAEADGARQHSHPPAGDADGARQYCRVRPSSTAPAPGTVVDHFRRLHRLDDWSTKPPLLDRLRGRPGGRDHIECLLVADPGADAPLEYLFGTSREGALRPLVAALRGVFPNDYEFDLVADPLDRPAVTPDDDARVAAAEFRGRADLRCDWQTRLTPFPTLADESRSRLPLAAVVETMANSEVLMVYQALLAPMGDWTGQADELHYDLRRGTPTMWSRFLTSIVEPEREADGPSRRTDEQRMEELEGRVTRSSFVVNARAVAVGEDGAADPGRTVRELRTALTEVGHTTHRIDVACREGSAAERVLEDVAERTLHRPTYERLRNVLPFTTIRSRGIVADPTEAPSFVIVGGDTLTAAGGRAVDPSSPETAAMALPPPDRLSALRGDGLVLGHPVSQDGSRRDEPLVLPPSLQPLHTAWFGRTGSGKSTALLSAIVANRSATDGADILLDPKGDGRATDYLRAHLAAHGDLEDVLYFDCARLLPAIPFFDIRGELAAGVSRETAVADRVDHYVEILRELAGREQFDRAIRSGDVIRALVRAMYDPATGQDAFGHDDLHAAAHRMHDRKQAPTVSDPRLARLLEDVAANRRSTFDEIMGGVANRIEKVSIDARLATMFDHVPEDDDPRFDLADHLDEDVVIVLDTADLRPAARRAVTLVVLSNLWTALRRRSRRAPDADHPLVNLYVEEAGDVATTDLLAALLARGRGFGCAVTLAMQYPTQLPAETADELLNNVSTILAGNVPADDRLMTRLATDDMGPADVGNRLRALPRGDWLASLPAPYGEPLPHPFLLRSGPMADGLADGPDPLDDADVARLESELVRAIDRTTATAGLTLPEPTAAGDAGLDPAASRLDSALPYARRLPKPVDYDADGHALLCKHCGNAYDPDIGGMRRAIDCCGSLAEVDRDRVPVCDLHLKLTPEECGAADWSLRQLLFLQAVYNAQQFRFDDLEYDLMTDSMALLREYVGIDNDAAGELVDAGLLTVDADKPHRLYTVTPAGREAIGEQYRKGTDYGHGLGDMNESTLHVFAVELARRYLEREYAGDPDSAVEAVVPYFEPEGRKRLDVAGVDADGEVVVAVEAERLEKHRHEELLADYDTLAEIAPAEGVVWVFMSEEEAHRGLRMLNDPTDGVTRVGKTYSDATRTHQWQLDAPGMTDVFTRSRLHHELGLGNRPRAEADD